jgi:hypothetical protein
MALHVFVFVFLLVVCFFLCLARLGRLDWFPLWPSSSKGVAKRPRLHRLRHRPAPQMIARPVVSPPLPPQVEGRHHSLCIPGVRCASRRGAPKRIDTQGFACPNRACLYFGNTDAHMHAASW